MISEFLAAGARAGARYAVGLPRHAPLGGSGVALGARAGSSLEFREYRDYQAGDDLRHIDWNAYARSDQYSVKLFREEVTPHVDIFLDASKSMSLAESGKPAASLGLAALFATAAGNAGQTHSMFTLRDSFRPVMGGTTNPIKWEGITLDHPGGPQAAFTSAPPGRPKGYRVLISDLLWDGEPLAAMRHLSERAAAVVVIQVLADADLNPPESGSLRLIDTESGEVREIHITPEVARRYRDALARHQEAWHLACRQCGAVFTTVTAERIIADWRLDDLVAAEVLKVV